MKNFFGWLKSILHAHASELFFCFGAVAWVCASLLVFGHNGLHPEAGTTYFPYYTAPDQTFLQKIFNPLIGNLNNVYRAREVSFVMDWIDYNLLLWTIRNIGLYFYSIIHVVLALLTAGINMLCAVAFFKYSGMKFKAAIATLHLLFTPFFFLSSGIYRSSRILTAFFVILILWYCVFCLFRSDSKGKLLKFPLLTTLFLGFVIALCDEQGIAMAALIGGIFAVYYAVYRETTALKLACGLLAGLLLKTLYGTLIGPVLLHHFHPQAQILHPDIAYRELLSRHYLLKAYEATANFIRQFTGSLPPVVFILLVFFMIIQILRHKAQLIKLLADKMVVFFIIACATGVVGVIVLNAGMLWAHPAIFSSEHEGFYGIPASALGSFLLVFAAGLPLMRQSVQILALLCLLLSNIISLNKYYADFRKGENGAFIDITALALSAMPDRHNFDPKSFSIQYAKSMDIYAQADTRTNMRLWPYYQVVTRQQDCAPGGLPCVLCSQEALDYYLRQRNGTGHTF